MSRPPVFVPRASPASASVRSALTPGPASTRVAAVQSWPAVHKANVAPKANVVPKVPAVVP